MSGHRIGLVGLDIDGTLLNSAGRITPRTKQAIAAALERGCAVAASLSKS